MNNRDGTAGSNNPEDRVIVEKTDSFVIKRYRHFDTISKMKELDKVTTNCIDW
jgi:hypothetical protein